MERKGHEERRDLIQYKNGSKGDLFFKKIKKKNPRQRQDVFLFSKTSRQALGLTLPPI
jgi:hypothetical protein